MANVKNYKEQGGEVQVIGGELRIADGGKITADGTQAAAIADLTESDDITAVRAAVNEILDAIRGAGIIASD
jgi:hypothetical protein